MLHVHALDMSCTHKVHVLDRRSMCTVSLQIFYILLTQWRQGMSAIKIANTVGNIEDVRKQNKTKKKRL